MIKLFYGYIRQYRLTPSLLQLALWACDRYGMVIKPSHSEVKRYEHELNVLHYQARETKDCLLQSGRLNHDRE